MRFSSSRKRGLAGIVGGVVLALGVVLAVVLARPPGSARLSEPRSEGPNDVPETDSKGMSPRTITNRFGMQFVEIPAGRFVMGSLRGAPDARPHVVDITRPFFLGVTEVTGWEVSNIGIASGKWGPEARVGQRPDGDMSHAIASWREATDLARTLSELDRDYDYRLPTEAEWEYACRAKIAALEPYTDDREVSQPYREKFGAIDPVKLEPPNAFGLYDMLRNNGEYCSDWYSPDYYQHSPLEDPKGPSTGPSRVARGVRSEGRERSYSAWRRYPVGPRSDGNILLGVRLVLEEQK